MRLLRKCNIFNNIFSYVKKMQKTLQLANNRHSNSYTQFIHHFTYLAIFFPKVFKKNAVIHGIIQY